MSIETDEGFVELDRRHDLPSVIISAMSFPKNDAGVVTTDLRFMAKMTHYGFGVSPNKAIELGKKLIEIAEDCKKYPDRRKI